MTSAAAARPSISLSVFVKLTIIMLAMTISLGIVVIMIFWIYVGQGSMESEEQLVKQFARAFIATNPSVEGARQLGTRLNLQIRYEGPRGAWTTSDDVPAIADARRHNVGHVALGVDHYLLEDARGGTYLFVWAYRQRFHNFHSAMLWLLLILTVSVVIVAYLSLRFLLRPLRGLSEGVARLSAGQFDVALPSGARDEFGMLTMAFNEMVGRIREMIRARDQLLLDVSHELRSPLTRLKVALELLPGGEKRQQMTADVAEMEIMISELLELERLRDGRGVRLVRQDVVALLRDVAESFRDRAPGVRLISGTQELLLEIDPDKLRIVFRNLLENAVKYSLPDSRSVQISTASDERSVVVRVSDDGPGIPEADVASLFEPFFRVDRSRSKKTGGYGLGLSICKRIVEAHGGTIVVENNTGRGASFIVTLPKPESARTATR
jgi:signal transduction histidine kinase